MFNKELKTKYKKGQMFMHKDGGIYIFESAGFFTEDQDEMIIYKHVWPFVRNIWIRRATEFSDGRFKEITKDDFNNIKKENTKIEYQKIVSENKAKRKK